MKKTLVFLVFIFAYLISYCEVIDEAKILKKSELKEIENKLLELEKNFNIKYKIVITDTEKDIKQYLKGIVHGVVIYLEKNKEEDKLKLRLYFSKDIDINTYREELQKILDDAQSLVDEGKYVELIYEVTGSISEIADLIKEEEIKASKRNSNLILKIIVGIISSIIGMLIFILVKKKRSKSTKCKFCNSQMELVDEYKENGKTVKLYNCNFCGHSKKISFRH